jgi:hypothetical protein
MADLVAVTPAVRQPSNYIAILLGTLGNALPYIAPQLLISLGVHPAVASSTLTLAAILLAAYQKQTNAIIVPTVESPK